MFYSICYDIRDDRRRSRVVKVLKDFGERVQSSVFEANLEPDQLERLRKRITPILDAKEDNLRFYPLCGACVPHIEIFGEGVATQDPNFIVI